MYYNRLFTFIILFLCAFSAKAAVFTVTSNADSGPGTLREALTLAAANGSTEKDFIYFNLPDVSEAGRTIILQTELPNVSSNLEINAATQLGGPFGVSDASVILSLNVDNPLRALLKLINVSNVEIFGVSFKGNWLNSTPPNDVDGISIQNSSAITIGGSGTGNLFGNLRNGIIATGSAGIYLRGNMAGLKYDGLTPYKNYAASNFTDCTNIGIGGTLPGERNVFTDYGQGEIFLTRCQTVNILGNFLGTDYTGNAVVGPSFIGNFFSAYGISANVTNNLTITNNVLSGLGYAIAVFGIQTDYIISNNRLGVGVSSGANLNNRVAISIYNATAKGTISNNIIAYNENGVIMVNSQPVTLSQNSFFCNIKEPISIQNSPVPIPAINVTNKSSTQISGTATPNADIELFYTDECQLCQGKTYIATVTADAAGNWSYTGPLAGAVVGTATSRGATSPFSAPNVITKDAVVSPAECGADGSITGFAYANATNIQWLDINGAIVGTDIDLVDVPPGHYRLRVDNGTCSSVTGFYEVRDNSFSIDGSRPTIVDPSCGLANGYVRYVLVNTPSGALVTIQWINDNTGQVASNSISLERMGPGTYSMHVKGANGCEKIYGPVTLTNSNGPAIIQANQAVNPSACSKTTGSITGIAATGTGTLIYSWKNEQNTEVGTRADLTDQPPGNYILTVTDETQCDPVSTAAITIPLLNDITINIANKVVKNATCENGDGSIKNVTVTPTGAPFTYVWTNERNEVKGNLKDLSFVQAGTYTLTVSGGSLCTAVQSDPIVVGSDDGVQLIRGANYKQKTDFCGKNTGEITGLETPGATTFLWINTDNNTTAGNNLNLVGVAGGHYRLTYSNATCSNYSDFEILSGEATIFTGFIATPTKSCYALNNGSISLNTDNAPEQPFTYRWVNAQGKDVAFTRTANNLSPGKYKVILTNQNNCPYLYPEEFTVGEYPQLVAKPGTPTNIRCGVGTGSISASVFTGGSASYAYQWFDEAGNALPGQTQSSISNVAKGKYRLHIEDGTCAPGDLDFEVKEESVTPTTPEAKDIKVYGNGSGTIVVTAPFETAIYRLYDTQTSPDAIAEVRGGKFNVTVTESRSYFITLTYGYCESDRTEVKVFLSALTGDIVNTFTPNGDGINDYWVIKGLDTYPDATVNIFNRYGKSVFQSTGYAKPFDGTYNGKPLPAGVYYYMINLKRGDILSGNVTILR
ncbi:gliding motility-associated C-terminal domain-containing protein [Mucilaginibacter sp.]|uniref:T9SS type B sorting domain-containing protein n=1 Tax=Mucilaginibacter sp. TaxID=1882438 RepID=UPI003265DFBC